MSLKFSFSHKHSLLQRRPVAVVEPLIKHTQNIIYSARIESLSHQIHISHRAMSDIVRAVLPYFRPVPHTNRNYVYVYDARNTMSKLEQIKIITRAKTRTWHLSFGYYDGHIACIIYLVVDGLACKANQRTARSA